MQMRRALGKSGIEVSAMGLGCWPIGGPFLLGGLPDGWGEVDDGESVRAVQRAVDLGVTFFDTADVYGAGHSERILGQALRGRRDQVVIATKFGFLFDETRKTADGINLTPDYIRQACEASLRRLQTEYIDLYQCHVGEASPDRQPDVWATLEELKEEGKIRAYGLSAGDAASARSYAEQTQGVSIQHGANVLQDAPDLFDVATEYDLANIVNSPLAMGLLSGKYSKTSLLPLDDVRGNDHAWLPYFKDRRPLPELIDRIEAVREVLTSGGRTLVQGALAWLWARSPRAIPIPGFKRVEQVEELCGAVDRGPLTQEQMKEIKDLLEDAAQKAV